MSFSIPQHLRPSKAIPQYLETRQLKILKTERGRIEGQSVQKLHAVDPEGDRVVITKQTQGQSMLATVPKTKLTVSYQKAGEEPTEAQELKSSEAHKLHLGLDKAQRNLFGDPDVDVFISQGLIADLGSYR